jgi:PAS domain S-box-containing protein
VILVSQAAQVLALGLAILFLVHRLLIRHLGAIASAARTTTIGTLTVPVVLARRFHTDIDELDEVVGATNTMRRSLAASYEQLRQVNAALEQDIRRRTDIEAALSDSETRLRTVVDNAPFCISELDGEGRVVLVNRPGLAILGLADDPDAVIGHRCPRLADVAEFERLVEDALGGISGGADITFGGRMFHAQTLPLSVPGSPRHVLVIVQDRTETHRALAEVQRLNDNLEQTVRQRTAEWQVANAELEAFAYSVSHDLRAPLRRVDGFSRILVEEHAAQLDDGARHFLDRIRAGSQAMGQTIDALLNLSRSSRVEMVRTETDLSAIAGRIAADLAARAPDRTVTWRIEPGITVEGDTRLLTLVLENLLGNAWKYSARQPAAEIAFGTETIDGERVFFVSDNGAGFDMAYAESLFKPFSRLHDTDEFEGTGIGLALVDRIIRRHGGRIWAEAAPGRGATFRFAL